ncbi:hypothetical protein GCM10011367_14870 [Marinicauda pacifica]|uniref:Helix-turn-helix domain-containing protein n=1 Tax=Marinicauda pacifica TaxID=1133559 RepID=A0A4S2HAF5_9PROT|nr:helix-turn-helix domain-containing protein [Marinicauda pacifica]TGY92907.1 helix-turn-helix domain-containing protein [Marinicauda pacifica]GGE41255.1 hypothetical protein GCM10011367_14870 [Marinicauda pacifica]
MAPKSKNTKQASAEKFGSNVIDRGFAIVPSVLLRCQERLKINGQQLALLIHLIDAWWTPDAKPWPSKASLAQKMQLSPKQIQRHMRLLEEAGYVQRKKRFRGQGNQVSNEYDLTGLVKRLSELADDLAAADQAAEEAKSGARRPGLKKRDNRKAKEPA